MSVNELLIDRETAHHCLKETFGNVRLAHELIAKAGVKVSFKEFNAYVKKDSVLSTVWGSRWKYDENTADAIEIRKPMNDEALNLNRLAAEQDFIAAQGLEKTGMEASDVKTLIAMAQVAQTSMGMTVDMCHVMMIEAINELRKEALRIKTDILLNNDTQATRRLITADGELLEYKGDKYTPEEKAEYTKVWLDIQDSIRKMAETAHKSVKVRAEVIKMGMGGIGDTPLEKKRPRRVKSHA